ncbi:Uncharacterized protein GBIM_02889 [Gryllus bimaculatus]|nr:Uncharacterized protein GBIM_02889 [Gryllus bimaculatus]
MLSLRELSLRPFTDNKGNYEAESEANSVGKGRNRVRVTLGRGDLGARYECRAHNAALNAPMVSAVNVLVNGKKHIEILKVDKEIYKTEYDAGHNKRSGRRERSVAAAHVSLAIVESENIPSSDATTDRCDGGSSVRPQPRLADRIPATLTAPPTAAGPWDL